ncbi:6-carboxytetrahydropterin synthase [Candidatus Pacearchaeota archaeon]|nr:6-carboxytetrahydropterin synthase [Candidatus Pacearchaeota archaeon]
MYTLMIKGKFDSAHRLPDYDGKCQKMHGHTWHVTAGFKYVTLYEMGSRKGMGQDFTVLKQQWKIIEDRLDHQIVNEIVGYATAENIAKWIFEEWKVMNPNIVWIEIWETEGAGVRYEP